MLRRRPKDDEIQMEAEGEEEELKVRQPPNSWSRKQKCCCWTLFAIPLLLSLCLLLVYLLVPCPIHAQVYSLPQPPELVGALAPNEVLSSAEKLLAGEILGPESIHLHGENIYTGLHDGRVVEVSRRKIQREVGLGKPPCGGYEEESTCGRPLGIRMNDKNELIVADAYLGLFKVNIWTGTKELLVRGGQMVEGLPLKFLNDLDLLDDQIFFTSSSSTWDRKDFINIFLEAKPDGRLLSYDLVTKELRVLASGLHFANGVQVSLDGKALFVAETSMARILKYHLSGGKEGQVEVFRENLPGLPDNIRQSSSGGLWVGMASVRCREHFSFFDFVGQRPWIRTLVAQLVPVKYLGVVSGAVRKPYGLVVELDQTGRLVSSLHDPTGAVVSSVSEVSDAGRVMFLGSYDSNSIVKVKL